MTKVRSLLRLGLLGLVGVLVLGIFSNSVLARGDIFDDGYTDCPAWMRVDAIRNLSVTRTAEEDEMKVSWQALDLGNLRLGTRYQAQITVIAEARNSNTSKTQNLPLATTGTVFKGIDFAEDWEVSVALTDRKHVISHIRVFDFISGVAKPKFSSPFYLAPATTGLPGSYVKDGNIDWAKVVADAREGAGDSDLAKTKGTFYYLGFNHNFDNYFVNTGMTNPRQPKFRVGLVHDHTYDPDNADFKRFRVRVEDEDGDNILGFDAGTTTDARTYDSKVMIIGTVFGRRGTANNSGDYKAQDKALAAREFSTIRKANQVASVQNHILSELNPYFSHTVSTEMGSRVPIAVQNSRLNVASDGSATLDQGSGAVVLREKLSYSNVMLVDRLQEDNALRRLFAPTPDQFYDLPHDIFSRDGVYTLTAWAENEDGEPISPNATLTLSIQERVRSQSLSTNLAGYTGSGNLYTPYASLTTLQQITGLPAVPTTEDTVDSLFENLGLYRKSRQYEAVLAPLWGNAPVAIEPRFEGAIVRMAILDD